MTQRRLQLVVNPAAGGGRAARLLPSVEQALRAAGHDLVVGTTTSLEHADELAAAGVADDRVVVSMGGDGIAGRVAGTVSATGGVMGVLPGGRGNDFCRAMGVAPSAVTACDTLASGVERPVDLGFVQSASGQLAYLGIASVGFDSEVQELALTTRLPLGQLVYLYGSLATVARWKHAHFTLTVDGVREELRGWSVAAANSGIYGGGMKLAPDARVDDGVLDLVTTSATGRLRFLRALPLLFKGTHIHKPSVTVRQVHTLQVSADRPFRVFADGDPVGELPCTITVRPGALRMLLPAPA